MFKSILIIPLFLGLCMTAQASSLDYMHASKCTGEEKFKWYCNEIEQLKKEIEKKVPSEPEQTPEKESASIDVKIPELVEHERLKKEYDDLVKIAYMNPTKENVLELKKLELYLMNKASVFAEMSQRVVWQNPEANYSMTHPVSTMAKKVKQQVDDRKKEEVFKELAKKGYGLFFFYKNDCPYCHAMKTPIKLLTKRTGLDVMSIAMDGKINDEFPNSKADQGQAKALGVTTSPTLILVNTKTKNLEPIAYGWTSITDIEERIYKLTATRAGENH